MNKPTKYLSWLTPLAVLLLAARVTAPARADYTATVDPTVQYQTWEGWGSSLAWWAKVVGGFPEPVPHRLHGQGV